MPAASPPPPDQRRRLVGVSTKMYFSAARTASFVDSVISLLSSSPNAAHLLSKLDAFLIPDFVTLSSTIRAIKSAPAPANALIVGAQDCCAHDFGAYTGEVSPAVLAEAGCRIVEVGHAERRRLFGEGDEMVRDKAAAVVRNGMWPLVCVGEGADYAASGVEAAAEAVLRQVGAVVEGLPSEADIVLAYEPVWAIGAAEPASAEHVREVVRHVRESDVVRGRRGRTRIVYGGAAGPGLWGKLGGEVDGLFLGRFAHQPEQFVKMLYEVAEIEVDC
ncbi:hypothetical protein VTK56DRAFT_4288 [Thermocarpiscus australiensis]